MSSPFLGTTQVGSFPSAGTRPLKKKHKIFTSSGIWVAPPGVYEVDITMCSGGGGGGNSEGPTEVGTGGGGGATFIGRSFPVIPGTPYNITVGAGGSTQSPGGRSSFIGGVTVIEITGGGAGGTVTGTGTVSGPLGGAAPGTINGVTVPHSTSSIIGVTAFYVPGGQGGGAGSGVAVTGSGVLFSTGGTAANRRSGGGASLLGNGGNGNGSTPTVGYGGGGGSAFFGISGAPGVVQLVWIEGE